VKERADLIAYLKQETAAARCGITRPAA